jgi:hypothetical protein
MKGDLIGYLVRVSSQVGVETNEHSTECTSARKTRLDVINCRAVNFGAIVPIQEHDIASN